MGVWIWFSVRDFLLITGGIFLIIADHQGWAAVLLFFFLIILIQSLKQGEIKK